MKTYKQIFIKSESDLPEAGMYHCQITENSGGYFHFNPDDKDDIDFWVGNVMYYLQPVEVEQKRTTEEQTSEEFAKMKNSSFMQIGCIDAKRDLWANINCENHIDPATCGRETSCPKCNKYKVVYTDEAIERRAYELAKIHSKQSVGDFAVGYLFGIKEPIKFKK